LRALFDTGSSNTWVASNLVGNKENFSVSHLYYDSAKSKTSLVTKNRSKSFFGSGNLEGKLVQDELYIGLNEEQTNQGNMIHLRNFTFGVMDKQEGILDHFNIDAIVGMGHA